MSKPNNHELSIVQQKVVIEIIHNLWKDFSRISFKKHTRIIDRIDINKHLKKTCFHHNIGETFINFFNQKSLLIVRVIELTRIPESAKSAENPIKKNIKISGKVSPRTPPNVT
jgi:hypothetical protein